MKSFKVIILILLPSLMWITSVNGRTLSQLEVQSLLKELTSQSQMGWIETGTVKGFIVEESWPTYDYANSEIEARIRSEITAFETPALQTVVNSKLQLDYFQAMPYNIRYAYRASTREELELSIQCHKGRYFWEATVVDFKDLADLSNYSDIPYRLTTTDEKFFAQTQPAPHAIIRFNPDWNQKRICSWDGKEHIQYNYSLDRMINHVSRTATDKLLGLPSPLTAGLIPWGYGIFTLENLNSMDVVAQKAWDEDDSVIILTLTDETQKDKLVIKAKFIRKISPYGKNSLALVEKTIMSDNKLLQKAVLSAHIWLSNTWVPKLIVTEKYNYLYGAERTTRKTLRLDYSTEIPQGQMVPSISGALVEYRAPGLSRSLRYRMSERIDNEAVLAEKLALIQRSSQTKSLYSNCATLSLGYAASQLGRPLDDKQLAELIDTNGMTNLQAMVQVARRNGLHAQAVRTDLKHLAKLDSHQVILHIPKKDHYIVLGDVDANYVWCIDLSKDCFLYRSEKQRFCTLEWTEGTALILSNTPIAASERYKMLESINNTENIKFRLSSNGKSNSKKYASEAFAYAAKKLNCSIKKSDLNLISTSNSFSPFINITNLAQQYSLYARLMKGCIDHIAQLPNCQVILYIPKQDNFVVLGDVDNRYVWYIDVAKDSLFEMLEKRVFISSEWINGLAIVLSNSPIPEIQTCQMTFLSDSMQAQVNGASDENCTNLIQQKGLVRYSPHNNDHNTRLYDICSCVNCPNGSCSNDYVLSSSSFTSELDPFNPAKNKSPDECIRQELWQNYYYELYDCVLIQQKGP